MNIRVGCLAPKYGSLKSHVSKKLCGVSVKGIQGIQDRAANKLLFLSRQQPKGWGMDS